MQKILVIDDSPGDLALVHRVISQVGAIPVLCNSAAEGLAHAPNGWSAIIIDINLPDMDGFELAHALRNLHEEAPVLIITGGEITAGIYQKAVGVRALTVVSKNMPASLLALQLKALCDLKKYADQAISLRKEMEQFAYVVSHDLAAPARKIVSFSDIIKAQYRAVAGEEPDERLLKYLGIISEAGQGLLKLISDLLMYSRAGKEPTTQLIDLRAVILSCVDSVFDASDDENGVKVSTDIPCAIPMVGDPVALGTLFRNLLSNSSKFADPDRTLQVSISVRIEPRSVTIIIEDNGVGFEQSKAASLFTAFRRLHHQRDIPGTGLGLSIAKKVVDAHRGRISACGQEGEGATFTILLPLEIALPEGARLSD
jgi:signal transduction histidine kinase